MLQPRGCSPGKIPRASQPFLLGNLCTNPQTIAGKCWLTGAPPRLLRGGAQPLAQSAQQIGPAGAPGRPRGAHPGPARALEISAPLCEVGAPQNRLGAPPSRPPRTAPAPVLGVWLWVLSGVPFPTPLPELGTLCPLQRIRGVGPYSTIFLGLPEQRAPSALHPQGVPKRQGFSTPSFRESNFPNTTLRPHTPTAETNPRTRCRTGLVPTGPQQVAEISPPARCFPRLRLGRTASPPEPPSRRSRSLSQRLDSVQPAPTGCQRR